jgi:hypothetical protein
MISKAAYFDGALAIGQLTQADVWLRVQRVAEHREPELLGDLLGSALYGELLAGLAKPADAPDGWQPQEQWTALEGKVARLAAAYVFYHYVRESAVSIAGAGAVETKTDNAKRAAPDRKLCDAWSVMLDGMKSLSLFMQESGREDPPRYPSYQPVVRLSDKYRPINVYGI